MAQIVLTGFMATGKTAVGLSLAGTLGRPFVDVDGLVEVAAGRSIRDIFATDGEAAFRAFERVAVEQACAVPDAVIATGGGTLLDPENRRRLAASGIIICLTAEAETILARVGDPATRPLLTGTNGSVAGRLTRIRALLTERAPVYALAHHAIDTTGLSVEQVVESVQALVAGR